jgi:hypothetical protein
MESTDTFSIDDFDGDTAVDQQPVPAAAIETFQNAKESPIQDLSLPEYKSSRKPKNSQEAKLPRFAGCSGADLTQEIRQYIQQRATEKTRELWSRKGVETSPRDDDDAMPSRSQAKHRSHVLLSMGRRKEEDHEPSLRADDFTYDRSDSIASVKRLHRQSEQLVNMPKKHTSADVSRQGRRDLEKKFSAPKTTRSRRQRPPWMRGNPVAVDVSNVNLKSFSRPPPSMDRSTYFEFPRRNHTLAAPSRGRLKKRQIALAALAIVSFQRLLLGMMSRLLV